MDRYTNLYRANHADNRRPVENGRRNLFTIQVGAITQWLRDLFAIILMYKLIVSI